ncbi:imelysin family protein [Candidatus Poriferisodalis sp.]|uniref:imelysin family protein n=1 Tax=Candidatus Poriferisodalis sp. TaxID=3101277 RepID=UPI003B01FB89
MRARTVSRTSRRVCAVLAAVALLGAACESGPTPRQEAVTSTAADAFSNHVRLNAHAATLADSVDELCATPGQMDEAAADRVADGIEATRRTWSYLESLQLESVQERRSWAVIDWPISTGDITSLLLDETKDLTPERIGKRSGADQRGLGAAEYLLTLHVARDGTMPAGTAQRRCDYLSSVVEVIREESELILDDAWLVIDSDDAPLFMLIAPDAEMGVDRLVNGAVFLLEAMTDMELGRALGETSAEARLDAIVEGPLGLGAADMLAHLDGLRTVLLGTEHATDFISESGRKLSFAGSSGFRLLLDDDVVSRLTDQFREAKTALERINGPLREAVVHDPETVSAARAALKALQVTISTEVVSQLGVTIGFSDADGDSSA